MIEVLVKGLLPVLGVIAVIIALIFLGIKIIGVLTCKFSKDDTPSRTLREVEAEKAAREERDKAAYQAELIARASKRSDGKVTVIDEFNSRMRHLGK